MSHPMHQTLPSLNFLISSSSERSVLLGKITEVGDVFMKAEEEVFRKLLLDDVVKTGSAIRLGVLEA